MAVKHKVLTEVENTVSKIALKTQVNMITSASDGQDELCFRLEAEYRQHYHFRRFIHLNHMVSCLIYDDRDPYNEPNNTNEDGEALIPPVTYDQKRISEYKVRARYTVLPREVGKTLLEGEMENLILEPNPIYESIEDFTQALPYNGNWDNIQGYTETVSKFKGATVVFTGRIGMTRDEASAKVREAGGYVNDRITRATDYVVVGKASGSKLKKAERYGIRQLTEDEFLAMLPEASDQPTTGSIASNQVTAVRWDGA